MSERANGVTSNAPNNENPEANQQQQQPQSLMSRIFTWLMFYVGFSLLMNLFNPSKNLGNKTFALKNILNDNTEFDVNFYIISSKKVLQRKNVLSYSPVLTLHDIKYTSEGNSSFILENQVEYELDISRIDENKTKEEKLFLYCDIVLKDKDLNDKFLALFSDYEAPFYQSTNLFKYSEDLNEQIRQQDLMNDFEAASIQQDNLEEAENKKEGNETSREYVKNLYYKPEIMMYLVSMEKEADLSSFEEIRVMGTPTKFNHQEKFFAPHAYLTDFWTMSSDLKPIEKTLSNKAQLKIKLDFKLITMFYFKYMRGVEMNSEMMENNFKLPGSKDVFVELLKNNSTTYLLIMFTVNILHTVFSALGFASDVSYYKNLKQLDGVYTKHLFFHMFQMAVTMIYVSIEGAHFLVKIELFIGLAVELWKLKKIFTVGFSTSFPFISIKYRIEFKQKKAKDYETEAVNLMLKYLFIPISVLYLSYRIYYYKKRLQISVFKFIIEYVFFLMNLFGFILLTPQVYLNYKLKSVNHLPFKALTFKFLNTIIDDLYAFAVKTPTLYRIFCFKDDVIFVIFIYQIIKYRKNKRAVEEEEEEVKEITNKEITNKEESNKEDSNKENTNNEKSITEKSIKENTTNEISINEKSDEKKKED